MIDLFCLKDNILNCGIVNNYEMINNIVKEDTFSVKNKLGSRTKINSTKVICVKNIAESMGMINLNKIDDFDGIDIPVYSVEHLQKRESIISYNSGKGMTNEQSKMSAMMEFIERKSATSHIPTSINKRFVDFSSKEKERLIEPASLVTHYNAFVSNATKINWYPVINLITGGIYLCPTIAVLFDYYDDKPLFLNNSNGLSSGSTYCEAIVQGIYEVVERDSISIAMAGGKIFSLDKNTITSSLCRTILEKYEKNGVEVNIKYVKNEFNMPCFIVTGKDLIRKSPYLLSGGFGCHSNVEIALIRALTELEQTRKVIFESKREDIEKMRPRGDGVEEYNRILKEHAKWYTSDGELIKYTDIATKEFKDIYMELKWQLDKLLENGYTVYASNLSCTSKGKRIPVVRVIIPGMENSYHDKKRVGIRLFNKAII